MFQFFENCDPLLNSATALSQIVELLLAKRLLLETIVHLRVGGGELRFAIAGFFGQLLGFLSEQVQIGVDSGQLFGQLGHALATFFLRGECPRERLSEALMRLPCSATARI